MPETRRNFVLYDEDGIVRALVHVYQEYEDAEPDATLYVSTNKTKSVSYAKLGFLNPADDEEDKIVEESLLIKPFMMMVNQEYYPNYLTHDLYDSTEEEDSKLAEFLDKNFEVKECFIKKYKTEAPERKEVSLKDLKIPLNQY